MPIGKRNITRQGQARIRGKDNWGKNTSPNSRFRPAASHGEVALLQMGWALKTARKKTMFSEEQKKYLTEQFVIGEESGKKADPKQVSQDMRKVRSESGGRLFLEKMFFHRSRCPASSLAWPPKFGRLRQQKPRNRRADDDEQQNAVEAESVHSQLHEVVHDGVALRHPIVSARFSCSSIINVTQILTRHHVLVVTRVITTIFYEIPRTRKVVIRAKYDAWQPLLLFYSIFFLIESNLAGL